MYAYVHKNILVHTYVHVYTNKHMYRHTYVHVCVLHTYVCVHTCMMNWNRNLPGDVIAPRNGGRENKLNSKIDPAELLLRQSLS
jgi:hypothetical protein